MIIRRDQPLANDQINQRGRPFENNHWRGRPLVYDHGGTVNNNNNNDNNNNNNNNYNNNNYNNIKKCKRSSKGTNLLQMIIQRGGPLANDHPKGKASCK